MSCFVVALLVLLSSCAFKPGAEPSLSPSSNAPTSSQVEHLSPVGEDAEVSWNREGAPKIKRTVYQVGQSFEVKHPVTLNESTPSELSLFIDLPKEVGTKEILFLRGSLSHDNVKTELPVDLHEVKDQGELNDRLWIVASGINSALLRTQKSKGVLLVEAFSTSAKLFEVKLPLRTPPAQVKVDTVPTSSFRADYPDRFELFQTVDAGSIHFNLVTALRLKNEDDETVWTSFPKEGGAQVVQPIFKIWNEDLGCDNRVHRAGGDEMFSERTFFILLNAQAITSMVSLARNEKADTSTVVELKPGEEQWIGVFSTGERVSQWRAQGARSSELSNSTVDTTCYNYCEQMYCPDPCAKCGVQIFLPCQCIKNGIRRNQTQVTVGAERGPVALLSSEAQRKILFRFSDLDSKYDPESRSMGLINERVNLEW